MSTQIIAIRRACDGVADIKYYTDDEVGLRKLITDYVKVRSAQISNPEKTVIDVGEVLIIRGTLINIGIGDVVQPKITLEKVE